MICRHYYILGRVQGVFYRSYVKQQARRLGITGWARNLSDGRVEVLACGETLTLQQFEDQLKKGSDFAEVTQIISTPIPTDDKIGQNFVIRTDEEP